jgi:hypothetical protein
MSALEKVNKSIVGFFKHPLPLAVIRIGLVLVLVFMPKMHRKGLSVFENVYFQVFYLSLMAYVALLDAPTALLMAAVYLFAIQQLNKSASPSKPTVSQSEMEMDVEWENTLDRQGAQLNSRAALKKSYVLPAQPGIEMTNDKYKTQQLMMMSNSDPDMFYVKQDDKMNNRVNELTSNFNTENFDADIHPAFKTMTENIASSNSAAFTTADQFLDAQSNVIANINQNQGIKVWENQMSAQGLDLPGGFDPTEYQAMKF